MEMLQKFLPNLPLLYNSTHFMWRTSNTTTSTTSNNSKKKNGERRCVKRPQLIDIQETFFKIQLESRLAAFSKRFYTGSI